MPATSSLSPSPCFKRHQSASHRPRWASLAKSALGTAVAVVTLTAGQAQALVVNVPGYGKWDVTTFNGTYNANISKFNIPNNGGMMPWWLDKKQTEAFANAVGSDLGTTPDTGNIAGGVAAGYATGPFFGYQELPTSQMVVEVLLTQNNILLYPITYPINFGSSGTWATAQAVAEESVPGPLPALGAAATFGFSRKLRSCINASKGVSSKAKTV